MKIGSSPRRVRLLMLCLLTCVGGHALAQKKASNGNFTFLPGAWSSNIQVTINGSDSTVLLQKVQAQLAQSLPAGIRESAQATFNNTMTRVRTATCISAPSAQALSSPRALFDSMTKINPQCRFTAGKLNATTQNFTGYCADPFAYTGPVSGRVIIDSTSSWRTTFAGTGQVPDLVLQALGLPPGSSVQMKTVAISTWASSTCPVTATVASVP